MTSENTATRPVVWCIAASDSSGGAGVTADARTVTDLGCHPCTVITAITAQNSLKVNATSAVPNTLLLAQLNALLTDLPPQAIKIGLLANQSQLDCLAHWLAEYASQIPIVLDPVWCASSGDNFGRGILDFTSLLALTTVFTPNAAEVSMLTGEVCRSMDELIAAMPVLAQHTPAHLLLTGGDLDDRKSSEDLLFLRHPLFCAAQHAECGFKLHNSRVNTRNNHGTGCMLSTAIAAFIAKEWVIPDAIILAHAYVHNGLKQSYFAGQGAGPVCHTGMPQQFANLPQILPLANKQRPVSYRTKNFAFVSPIYPVVNSCEQLAELLRGGCLTVQLRIKSQAPSQLEANVKQAVQLAKRYHAQLFINDHWQLALKYHAYGVHLGQEDLANADLAALRAANIVIGLSSHSIFEALLALNYQPDYLALGHIFATTTKVMPSLPQGLSRLRYYAQLFSPQLATVAIGGIDINNLISVRTTGVHAAAVVRAVTQAENIATAYLTLLKSWQPTAQILEASYEQ